MAGVTTAVIVAASAASSAYAANRAASAKKKEAKFARSETERQQQMEEERINLQRTSPGAAFAPFGFSSILDVFAKSMAGKAGSFDAADAKRRMGLLTEDGQQGPLYGGFSSYRDWVDNGRNFGGGGATAQVPPETPLRRGAGGARVERPRELF